MPVINGYKKWLQRVEGRDGIGNQWRIPLDPNEPLFVATSTSTSYVFTYNTGDVAWDATQNSYETTIS